MLQLDSLSNLPVFEEVTQKKEITTHSGCITFVLYKISHHIASIASIPQYTLPCITFALYKLSLHIIHSIITRTHITTHKMDRTFPNNRNPSNHPLFPPLMPPLPPPNYQPVRATLPPYQQQDRAKHELWLLQLERRTVIDALNFTTAQHKQLAERLGQIEMENEQWRSPNSNLGELYRLRDEIGQAESMKKEFHRRWDQLAEQIEEKHDEIAFGGSGRD